MGRPPRCRDRRSAICLLGWDSTAARSVLQLDLELDRLALHGDAPTIVAACATGAVHQLRRGLAADASRLAHDAIELLDRHNRAVPLSLLRAAAHAALTGCDGDTGEALLD